ncbi:MAG: hypothetical protein N5P05_003150 [Chroococcopsis gigantea SAG 12.99]|jgi:hypothetical protein|nr:FAD-dependent oxidoreductase [Chlorogloea purpurea SAG 13.99]MDV3001544.1 hypothetical protein [Chroococcopsis gigantea SAG 12.99]
MNRKWLYWLIALSLAITGLAFLGAKPPAEKVTKETTPPPDNGRPQLNPLPKAESVWECEVVVIGGTLGGVAAASGAMKTGATTCLIELSPWLGGQISSQGVPALDESLAMRAKQNFSLSWQSFKSLIARQQIKLINPGGKLQKVKVKDINSCWVAKLCFPPLAGAMASEKLLQDAKKFAPASRWSTSVAFKGARFDKTGQIITAVYGVQRQPHKPDYAPSGRLSQELGSWYSWSSDDVFEKTPIKLQAPQGKRMMVIDATDTGELVGWANIPHRLGSESKVTTGEKNGSDRDNPQCTQAFTYPFLLTIQDDKGASIERLKSLESAYSKKEHRRDFHMEAFPVFEGRSFFQYRRLVSWTRNDPFTGAPSRGDITVVNWNRGNDWNWMNPPLIFTAEEIDRTGQRQNWLGGISKVSLGHGEERALLFAHWTLEKLSTARYPLSYLWGGDAPMGTESGLSILPYIREGRRILGRAAYGQKEFLLREADIRNDMSGGRDLRRSAIALTHYDIDIHGCRYRNWEPSGEASGAPAREFVVRPTIIPLESLIPQGVDNLLIGGKAIAVTHIVNAVTRVHYAEWSVGGAAGVTAAVMVANPRLTPEEIVKTEAINTLQKLLVKEGLRLTW